MCPKRHSSLEGKNAIIRAGKSNEQETGDFHACLHSLRDHPHGSDWSRRLLGAPRKGRCPRTLEARLMAPRSPQAIFPLHVYPLGNASPGRVSSAGAFCRCHIQNQAGLLPQVQQKQRAMGKSEANNLQSARWSCKQTAWVKSGRTARRLSGNSLKPKTLKLQCRPLRPSETIGCSTKRKATSCRTHSLTALQHNARVGSSLASSQETCPVATRLALRSLKPEDLGPGRFRP